MASDKQEFSRATEHWNDLHDQRAYSVAAYAGTTAILCCQAVFDSRLGEDVSYAVRERFVARERQIYQDEATEFALRLQQNGVQAEIHNDPTRQRVIDVIQDRRVSSVITIGSGSLHSLLLEQEDDHFDFMYWNEVGKITTHLKQGWFIQRQCGYYATHGAPVPFSAFAMSRFSRVLAATGHFFEPVGVNDPANILIQPFTNADYLSYGELRTKKQSFKKAQTQV